jgi:hypothetical protein
MSRLNTTEEPDGPADRLRVGIIGAGRLGQAMARTAPDRVPRVRSRIRDLGDRRLTRAVDREPGGHGVGAALIMPAALSIITNVFPADECYPVCTPTPVTPGRVHWGTGRPPFLGPIGAPSSSVRKKEWVGNCGHPSGESSHSSRRP